MRLLFTLQKKNNKKKLNDMQDTLNSEIPKQKTSKRSSRKREKEESSSSDDDLYREKLEKLERHLLKKNRKK
jgi:hypothetical protein